MIFVQVVGQEMMVCMDNDGYGHYLGEFYEVWFNVYQADFDHDGIPYWTEVNVLGTDPTVDEKRP